MKKRGSKPLRVLVGVDPAALLSPACQDDKRRKALLYLGEGKFCRGQTVLLFT